VTWRFAKAPPWKLANYKNLPYWPPFKNKKKTIPNTNMIQLVPSLMFGRRKMNTDNGKAWTRKQSIM